MQLIKIGLIGWDGMRKSLLGLFCLLPLISFAATEDPCVTQRNTIEMDACAQKQFDQGDARLNQSYQSLLKKYAQKSTPEGPNEAITKYLITAQRAWVTFRENDCKAVYSLNEGGTLRNIAYLGCMTQHAEQRTKDFKEFDQ